MDQNQTPTPQPDYGFIVNQAEPAGGPSQKAPKNKKLIIVIVLVVITAILVPLFIILGNDAEEQPSTVTQTVLEQPETKEQELALQFLQLAGQNNTTAAYALMDENTRPTQDYFVSEVVPAWQRAVRLDDCKAVATEDNRFTTIICPSTAGQDRSVTFEFDTVTLNGQTKIVRYFAE